MIWILLAIIFWLACGAVSYAMSFAYYQRKYPELAEADYMKDRTFSLTVALLGPLSLIPGILRSGYGLKWK
jgi:hypothetical protein